MGIARPQAKLTVGAPDDVYEQEADRVARQVMTAPEPRVARQAEEEDEEDLLQAKPVAGTITPLVQRQGEEEEDLQMQPANGASPVFIRRQELPEEEEEEAEAIQAKGKARPSHE